MSRKLTFKKESDNNWYIDLPAWPGPHHALQMVAGADDLLDYVSEGRKTITVEVTTSNNPIEGDGILMSRYQYSLTGGAHYHTNVSNIPHAWLCPVTLFVYQRYPKYIFIAHSMNKDSEE